MTKLLDQALAVVRRLPSDAQDDIARVLGRPVGTTKTLMRAALHKLRRVLREEN